MDDDALADSLSQFGLSEKEIDTYLAILRSGEAKASTIADEANVSKRYVYSISEELESRGFVEVNDHSVPTTIRARPPEAVLGGLSDTLDTLEPALESRYIATDRSVDEFEVIKSRSTVTKRIETVLAEAEAEVTLSIPRSLLPTVRPYLEETTSRGVLVLLLIGGDDGEPDDESAFAGIASAVRRWRERVPLMLTVDGTYGVVAPNAMLSGSNSDSRAISIAQQQVTPVLVGSFLGNYWPMAEEVYVDEPAPLPATYTGFRTAVFQVLLHRRAGARVEVTVEGTPTDDRREPTTITGEVVSVRQSLIRPATNTLPVENGFVVDTGEETLSIGGPGAFIEDFEAHSVTIRALAEE